MPLMIISTAERLPLVYEGATIFFHRLTYQERQEVNALTMQRGLQDMQSMWTETAKLAVDGWDEQVLDADGQPLPVPQSGAEQRAQIGAIVEHFPMELAQRIFIEAMTGAPESLKKRWPALWPDALPLSTDAADASSGAATAASNGAMTD